MIKNNLSEAVYTHFDLFISSLFTFKVRSRRASTRFLVPDNAQCAICLSDYAPSDEVMCMPCGGRDDITHVTVKYTLAKECGQIWDVGSPLIRFPIGRR